MLYRPGLLFAFGLLGVFAGCSSAPQDRSSQRSDTRAPGTVHGAPIGANPALGVAGSGASDDNANNASPGDGSTCASHPQEEGCSCKAGETAACWTGSAADRNVGQCHDGLRVCQDTGDGEFASWGPCMGEQRDCGMPDSGMPPPPPEKECKCIPGAVIQCSEDCSVGIICSLTATKTCLPDGTWSVCREDPGAQLAAPGVQCRNMLHGCLDVLNPDTAGQNELYVGDCSTQFDCGHSPPPPENPPPPPPPDDPVI